jgi:hypothetical protein
MARMKIISGVHYSVAQNTSMFILKDILFAMVWKNVYGMFPHRHFTPL